MYRFLKFSFLFFSFFWIVSCQLNDTLTKIRENITININDGKDIDYVGVAGDQEIDANGDVSNTIEVWTIEDGKITSTGRFESP